MPARVWVTLHCSFVQSMYEVCNRCHVQLLDMALEELEMPGQHLPAPDAPDVVRCGEFRSELC